MRISFIREATEEMREIRGAREIHVRGGGGEVGEKLRMGIMVPLFKKGDRANLNNYRRVVLLAMASRVFARVSAKRLAWWTEHLGLVEKNQSGFRKGRSTADTVQIIVRMQEDVEDSRKVAAGEGGEAEWLEF